MAAFADLLQRIVRSLEEAGAQQPGDDLRARLGYGTGDEDELAQDAVWEPETVREPEGVRGTGTAHGPETARAPRTARMPGTVWAPEESRTPATLRTSGAYRTRPPDNAFTGRPSSPATPPYPHASPASLLSERIRARLRTPDALREAFVVKEILDRPLERRRRK